MVPPHGHHARHGPPGLCHLGRRHPVAGLAGHVADGHHPLPDDPGHLLRRLLPAERDAGARTGPQVAPRIGTARRPPIQETLQPTSLAPLAGYEVDAFYKPFREVGGDYFDVIDLPGGRTLFAVADVSGKGMPAALLAANIQALVRSLSTAVPDVPALASQINRHLCRYTPGNRFATAVFIVLERESGAVSYVNAGHNPPIVWGPQPATFLEPTGTALGWFEDMTYDAGRLVIPPDGGLVIFTDGLPDSIPGDRPEESLCRALHPNLSRTMANLKALVDPRFNEDDVTVLLLKRAGSPASGNV